MALWAGIDEAGYGPRLGPLVVAGTAFLIKDKPLEGILWTRLRDAVTRHAKGSDGRVVVNDSKQLYSPARGLRRLEEGVLSFLSAGAGRGPGRAGALLALLEGGNAAGNALPPWFNATPETSLPLESNRSAIKSMSAVLKGALAGAGVKMLAPRSVVVFPSEFNRIVARTHNKSFLLFQKCGLLLQELWKYAGPGEAHVVVDKHGGRMRYRRLLLDVFPDARCDILREKPDVSAYRIRDGDRTLHVVFKPSADSLTLPAALASMIAKYVRELYMHAFNRYWRQLVDGLKPTAGYSKDARRFLRDIEPALKEHGIDRAALVRLR